MKKNLLAAATFGVATAAAAFLGSQFTPSGDIGRWYDSLDKPPFTPPNVTFPIVWTTLYVMIAVSAFRVWKAGEGTERTRALTLWGTQLALNAAWSPIFFGARQPALALIDLVALFVAIAAYTNSARRIDRPAAWMMAPYLAWVAFAGVLNAEIARRN
ncbi:MAG: TspO/MBR family protein [Thermoanaerobaculia bacterium]